MLGERLFNRNMDIKILHLLEGADQAEGLAVVIDVFRAFSLECYLFSRGVQKIYAVGREETAWELKRKHPEYLMAGERGGMRIAFVLLLEIVYAMLLS